jgi:hypothetical protein
VGRFSVFLEPFLGAKTADLLKAAKAEFDKSPGPGFVYRSLVGDRAPPLDYRKGSNSTGVDPG